MFYLQVCNYYCYFLVIIIIINFSLYLLLSYPILILKDLFVCLAKLNEDMIHYKSDFIRCATYLDELRIIAFGCQDGKIRFLSLADFLPAVTSSEKMEMQRSLQDMLSKKSATIQPANKSTRGKRQIIS